MLVKTTGATAPPGRRRPAMPELTAEVARFWTKVDKRSGNECWNWKAGVRGKGYGCFRYEGKMETAHRVAWMMEHGQIPAGLHLLHYCDNPLCVNPAHCFLGTNHDNVLDRHAKGRTRVDPSRPNASKTECKRGHSFDEINTHLHRGKRVCRKCALMHLHAWRGRKRGT